jgi:hypothetical protein
MSIFDEHKRLNELINHYDTLVSEVLLENEKSKHKMHTVTEGFLTLLKERRARAVGRQLDLSLGRVDVEKKEVSLLTKIIGRLIPEK